MNPTSQNDRSSTGDDIHARIDQAAKHAKQATSKVKCKVDHAADRAEEGLHNAADAGARGAHRAADKAGEWHERGAHAASGARDRAADAADNLRALVREKPIESVAIALAVGWLVGRVLKPRH